MEGMTMQKQELKEKLLAWVTEKEWEQLQKEENSLLIGEFNRLVILNLKEKESQNLEGTVSEEKVKELYDSLKEFLQMYMDKQPEGHKWVILASIALTYIEEKPMHPQEVIHWVQKDGIYFCPACSEDSVICRQCMCEKLKEADKEV